MNATEIKAQTKEVIIKHYDDYKAGKTTYDDWVLYLIDLLDNYIKYHIRVTYKCQNRDDFEDFQQQGREAIIRKAPEYDPHQAMPTVFFTPQIEANQQKLAVKNGSTAHYTSEIAMLNKIACNAGYDGLKDPDLTANILITLSGESATTVIRTLDLARMSTASIEATSENLDFEGTYENPEDIIIKQEASEFAISQWKRLTPLEQFLIRQNILAEPAKGTSVYDDDDEDDEEEETKSNKKTKRGGTSRIKKPWLKVNKEHMSYCELTILFNDKDHPEWREMFKDELPKKVKKTALQVIVNKALEKLSQSPETQEYLDYEDDLDYEEIEQATEDELEKAMMDNLLDLSSEIEGS